MADTRTHITTTIGTTTLCRLWVKPGIKVLRVLEEEMGRALDSGADTCADCAHHYHMIIEPRLARDAI